MSQEIVPDGKLGTADLCSRRTVHGLGLHDKHLRRICQVVAPQRRKVVAWQIWRRRSLEEDIENSYSREGLQNEADDAL
jgi:hypothetical protein